MSDAAHFLAEGIAKTFAIICCERNIFCGGVENGYTVRNTDGVTTCRVSLHAGILSLIRAIPAEERARFFSEYKNAVLEARIANKTIQLPEKGKFHIAMRLRERFGTVSFDPVISVTFEKQRRPLVLKGMEETPKARADFIHGSEYHFPCRRKSDVVAPVAHMMEEWVFGVGAAKGVRGRKAGEWMERVLAAMEVMLPSWVRRDGFPGNVFFEDQALRYFFSVMEMEQIRKITNPGIRDACLAIVGEEFLPSGRWPTFMVKLDASREKGAVLSLHGPFAADPMSCVPSATDGEKAPVLASCIVPECIFGFWPQKGTRFSLESFIKKSGLFLLLSEEEQVQLGMELPDEEVDLGKRADEAAIFLVNAITVESPAEEKKWKRS